MKPSLTYAISEASKKATIESLVPSWVSNNLVSVMIGVAVMLIWLNNKFGAKIIEFLYQSAVSKIIQNEVKSDNGFVRAEIERQLKEDPRILELTANHKAQEKTNSEMFSKMEQVLTRFDAESEKNKKQEEAIEKLFNAVNNFSDAMNQRMLEAQQASDQRQVEFGMQMNQMHTQFKQSMLEFKDEWRTELNQFVGKLSDTAAQVGYLSKLVYDNKDKGKG